MSKLVPLLDKRLQINIDSNKYNLEIAKWSLSVMIQISYLNPNEFGEQNISRILHICGLQAQYDSVKSPSRSEDELGQLFIKI